MAYNSKRDTLSHILAVKNLLKIVAKQLKQRGKQHDKSKLYPPEKEILDQHSAKKGIFGSNEYKQGLVRMEIALGHHYVHNSHHPECHPNSIDGMSLIDLTEMLCDWVAASRRDEGDIFGSIEINQERFKYTDELKSILRHTAAAILAEED